VRLHGLTLDADGHVWGTLETTGQIIRFNTQTKEWDKTVQFSAGSGPHDAILGPDGNIYVVLTDNGKIGQYNPRTEEVREFATSLTPQDGNSLVFLTVGPDPKFLWFSEFLNDRIGRLNIETGEVTEFTCGISPNSGPIGIVVGPDGNIWFSEPVLDTRVPGRMGRLVVADANRFTTAEQRYVGRLYRDLRGREADPAGLEAFSSMLARGTANRFQVALANANSQEARIQAVMRTYLMFLGRPATDEELGDALGLLAQGGTIGQLEANVASSLEYFRVRGQGTNEGFVAALFHDLLGRTPGASEFIVYTQAGVPNQLGRERSPELYPASLGQAAGDLLSASRPQIGQAPLAQLRIEMEFGAPRSTFATVLINSFERSFRTAAGLYGRFIAGPPDEATVNRFAEALQAGIPANAVFAEVAASTGYLGLGEKPRIPGR
jgi:hypothetical protein